MIKNSWTRGQSRNSRKYYATKIWSYTVFPSGVFPQHPISMLLGCRSKSRGFQSTQKWHLVSAENCQQLPIFDNPRVLTGNITNTKVHPALLWQSVCTCNTGVLTQDSRTTELEDVCNKGFEMNEGHFVHSLDMALASMNVHRRAYHGWTFIGNHLHKCLTVGNYNHTLMLLIRILLIFRQN